MRIFIVATVFFFSAGLSFGTELYIPQVKTTAGQTVEIPIMIDHIDNLAGIKLKLKYDANILKFMEGTKTKHTSPLMHVVNDKNPGVLIIVMAGAKGIKGKEIALFLLKFKTHKDLKSQISTKLSITELQLMGDDLKDIKCTVKVNEVVISPSAHP